MARGGIHDQLGGGFARYSVDASWVVPHFEKMLYDNALLLGTYVRGWRRTADHDPTLRWQHERVVRGIVGWLQRELRTESGGFASSLDADSLDAHGNRHEGIYYCWSPELLTDALGPEDGEWASGIFHVTSTGTFEHGLSTLQLRGHPDPQRLATVTETLLSRAVQSLRPGPRRQGGGGLERPGHRLVVLGRDGLQRAELARFGHRMRPRHCGATTGSTDGCAAPAWTGWPATSPGFAEDYGAVATGFARLAGATGSSVWLERAHTLVSTAVELFSAEDGGFYDTAADAEQLWARPRSLSDNPTPSGASTLIAGLRLVGLLRDEPELIERADRAALTLRGLLQAAPRFAGAALTDALIADEARSGLRPAVAVVIGNDPLDELARATWRMAPAGTAVLTGPAGTPGIRSSLRGAHRVLGLRLSRDDLLRADHRPGRTADRVVESGELSRPSAGSAALPEPAES